MKSWKLRASPITSIAMNLRLRTVLTILVALGLAGLSSAASVSHVARSGRAKKVSPSTKGKTAKASSFPGSSIARGGASNTGASSFPGSSVATRGGASNTRSAGLSFSQRMWMGGLARALSQMTLYPIDALRTLAQTRDGKTLADVGVAGLVRGSTTTSMFALFMGSLQFSVFGACRDTVGPFFASILGAASSCVVSVPQEVIKQRLVTNIYPSFRSALYNIYKNENGIRGFYSAWRPTMARNVPFVAITFTTMDFFKSQCLQRQKGTANKKELTTLQTVAIGMSAALVAGIITQPVDVIKTRLMTQAASNQTPYTSAVDCFLTILRTEGPATFYAGFLQRSTYMCLLWGMTFALNGFFQKKTSSAS